MKTESDKIVDFIDLDKPFDFKYKENKYRIPALNKSQLIAISNINSALSKDIDEEEQNGEEQNDKKEKENNVKYLDVQDKMIISVTLILDKENDKWSKVEQEHIEDWPLIVKQKVIESINKQMSTSTEEDDTEKK